MVFFDFIHDHCITSFATVNSIDDPTRHCESIHNGHGLRLDISSDNIRSLAFPERPGLFQSRMRCTGEPPTPVQHGQCDDQDIRAKWKCRKPDFSTIDWIPEYVRIMLGQLVSKCQTKPLKVLFLGLGGGTMPTYLETVCPEGVDVSVIEHSNSVVAAARDFFGFRGDVIIEDAHVGLQNLLNKKSNQFDAIVVDICDSPMAAKDVNAIFQLLKPGAVVLQNWGPKATKAHQKEEALFDKLFVDVQKLNVSHSGRMVVIGTKNPDTHMDALREELNSLPSAQKSGLPSADKPRPLEFRAPSIGLPSTDGLRNHLLQFFDAPQFGERISKGLRLAGRAPDEFLFGAGGDVVKEM